MPILRLVNQFRYFHSNYLSGITIEKTNKSHPKGDKKKADIMKTKTKRILTDLLEVVGWAMAIVIMYAFVCMIGGKPL